jgi:hypothetical protein
VTFEGVGQIAGSPLKRLERSRELGVQTRLLVRRQWRRPVQVFLGKPRHNFRYASGELS